MGIGWTTLSEPRWLTVAEQAVLDRLVAQANIAELTAQAASACVIAVCDCGCRSVRLRSDAPPLARAAIARTSSTGRDDWFSIDSSRVDDVIAVDQSTSQVRLLQVVVHVVEGSLHELEIFAGEGVAVEVPPPDELKDITLT